MLHSPSKKRYAKSLTQCWVDVGPPSTTLAQPQPNLNQRLIIAGQYRQGETLCLCWYNVGPAL